MQSICLQEPLLLSATSPSKVTSFCFGVESKRWQGCGSLHATPPGPTAKICQSIHSLVDCCSGVIVKLFQHFNNIPTFYKRIKGS